MNKRELMELQRKAFIYDVLTADPGPELLETLTAITVGAES